MTEGEKCLQKECANAVSMWDVFTVIPPPAAHAHMQSPSEQPKQIVFSLKVEAAFINSFRE